MSPLSFAHELSRYNPHTGEITGATLIERRLSELTNVFADSQAYTAALAQGDPVLYTVASVQPDDKNDALFYAMSVLYPGRIGDEYYMTRGHYHALRTAPEVYLGLSGEGMMLLQDEATGVSRAHPLGPNSLVYVPGHTAHRTMNVGETPLVYLAICPLAAGHDYESIAKTNFNQVIVAIAGKATVLDRKAWLS